jgi:hypothetical protein
MAFSEISSMIPRNITAYKPGFGISERDSALRHSACEQLDAFRFFSARSLPKEWPELRHSENTEKLNWSS